MAIKEKSKDKRDWLILTIGGIVIVLLCIFAVFWLIGKSMDTGIEIPQYSIAFFSSITTLILGYLFGKGGNK
jgi:predicted Co/Zn/Cd cation transporter (cation efflux family)